MRYIRHFMIKLTVSILGEGLINWINCFDLKDPPPPKPPKVRENAEVISINKLYSIK